MNTKFLTIVIG